MHRPLGVAVVRRPGPAGERTRPADTDHCGELVHRGGDQCFDFGSRSALSAKISKIACVFPMMSRAILVLASSASSRSTLQFAFANAAASPAGFGTGDVTPALPVRRSVPASRARRHSTMCYVCRPSRRKNAPFSPLTVIRS